VPDLVVGDLDSSDPTLLAQLETQQVPIERYQHYTRIETDTELAALAALRWDPATIVILGGMGGRIDHSLANVLLLTHPRLAERDVRLVEGRQVVLLIKPGRWNDLPAAPGDTVSLLPLGDSARGISTRDLEYPLDNEDLLQGSGRGVSNVVTGQSPRVRFEHGQLLAAIAHSA
jgi:thiamine pyrophosphokinase